MQSLPTYQQHISDSLKTVCVCRACQFFVNTINALGCTADTLLADSISASQNIVLDELSQKLKDYHLNVLHKLPMWWWWDMFSACLACAFSTFRIRIFLNHVFPKLVLPPCQFLFVVDYLLCAKPYIIGQRNERKLQMRCLSSMCTIVSSNRCFSINLQSILPLFT